MGAMTRHAALLLGLLFAATPAAAQMGGGGRGLGGVPDYHAGSQSSLPPPSSRKPDPEGDAQQQRAEGHCDKAVPILRSYAQRGSGYEVSQYDLGLCLLDMSQALRDEKQADAMRADAAQWIMRAANAGFPKAQAQAVNLYLDGSGVEADKVEAEKWAMIYRTNSLRLVIGLPDIDEHTTDKLDGTLNDADRAQAQSRADAWNEQAHPQEP
jgi:hypothetical protein